jgi:hypothetical protein
MPPSDKTLLIAAQAEDLKDLLTHIAWTDVLEPQFAKAKDALSALLVQAVLGQPVTLQSVAGPVALTAEQIAGKIYGLDWVQSAIVRILRRGDNAIEELRKSGLSLV